MPNKILFVTALTAIYAGGYIHANTFDFNAEAKRLAIQSSGYSAVVKTAESDLLELKSENSLAPLKLNLDIFGAKAKPATNGISAFRNLLTGRECILRAAKA